MITVTKTNVISHSSSIYSVSVAETLIIDVPQALYYTGLRK
jgi:hypothetical protein